MGQRELMQTFDNTGSLTWIATILADCLFGNTVFASLVRQNIACNTFRDHVEIYQTANCCVLAK